MGRENDIYCDLVGEGGFDKLNRQQNRFAGHFEGSTID